MLSIAFFQVCLTPYLLAWVGASWAEYGRWTIGNLAISAVVGPVLLRLTRWLEG